MALLWTIISFALSLAAALSLGFPQIISRIFEPRSPPSLYYQYPLSWPYLVVIFFVYLLVTTSLGYLLLCIWHKLSWQPVSKSFQVCLIIDFSWRSYALRLSYHCFLVAVFFAGVVFWIWFAAASAWERMYFETRDMLRSLYWFFSVRSTKKLSRVSTLTNGSMVIRNRTPVIIRDSQCFYIIFSSYPEGIWRWLIVQNVGNHWRRTRARLSTAAKTAPVPLYLFVIPTGNL